VTHVIVTATQYGIHQVQNDDATGTLEITAIPFIALVANPYIIILEQRVCTYRPERKASTVEAVTLNWSLAQKRTKRCRLGKNQTDLCSSETVLSLLVLCPFRNRHILGLRLNK
jgi:hypothetical protein